MHFPGGAANARRLIDAFRRGAAAGSPPRCSGGAGHCCSKYRTIHSRSEIVLPSPHFAPTDSGLLLDPLIRAPSSAAACSNLRNARRQLARGFLSFGDGDEDRGLSKHHEEQRLMGYSPEQLFDVVAGVDLYQDFVPWCQKSRILWRTDEQMEAELEIGFQFFVESYTSHVELKRPTLVKTTVSQSSIFEHLTNVWNISPGPSPGSCNLHFVVDFQFRSPLYSKVANMFFDEVVARLVSAFENRCLMVYGPSKVARTHPA